VEFRRLGRSGLKVPALGFGTATFGGEAGVFEAWGQTDQAGARRLVDICLDAGVTLFDTANSYSGGLAEEILGRALGRRRGEAILATKVGQILGEDPNQMGSSRSHVLDSVKASLRRLQTDYIDILFVHEFDGTTPVEETVRVLDELVTSGKVRYLGASNFSGWQLMKSLAIADREGHTRYAAHQVPYSLAVREYEWELAPLAAEEGVGGVVWSPLAGSALTGKLRRGAAPPSGSRLAKVPDELMARPDLIYRIVDTLAAVAEECGKTVSQVALNWVLHRPTVSNVVLGARRPEQLIENLDVLDWRLSADQVSRLDEASKTRVPFPYSHQRRFAALQAPLTDFKLGRGWVG
jgi:aryl-alcohol dehydrogenase-like predicted oxidoreductase